MFKGKTVWEYGEPAPKRYEQVDEETMTQSARPYNYGRRLAVPDKGAASFMVIRLYVTSRYRVALRLELKKHLVLVSPQLGGEVCSRNCLCWPVRRTSPVRVGFEARRGPPSKTPVRQNHNWHCMPAAGSGTVDTNLNKKTSTGT